MKVLPIIFSAPMVLALLAGRKTMTRRLLYTPRKKMPKGGGRILHGEKDGRRFSYDPPVSLTEFYDLSGWEKIQPGDLLYVRENLTAIPTGTWRYSADKTSLVLAHRSDPVREAMEAWTRKEERGNVPSIHMPRWASRITIQVGTTKIERVSRITEADALAEGAIRIQEPWKADFFVWEWPIEQQTLGDLSSETAATGFQYLWEALHGTGSWEENPWVVAIGGKVHFHNVDSVAMKNVLAEAT